MSTEPTPERMLISFFYDKSGDGVTYLLPVDPWHWNMIHSLNFDALEEYKVQAGQTLPACVITRSVLVYDINNFDKIN